MKTQDQIEKALSKYQSMLDSYRHIMEMEEKFLEAGEFMEHKDVYIQSARRYHEAELVVCACEKLIKNCKWILDIE